RLHKAENGGRMRPMKKNPEVPRFKNETAEAEWWASPAGRTYVKKKSAANRRKGISPTGSSLVANLNKKQTVQIALRLPEADLKKARDIADRKGIGYQTLLKMFVHESLEREARRR